MQGVSEPEPTARLFERLREGDEAARDELVASVYHELRRIASRELRGLAADHTLQATALVHEAYVRLVGGDGAIAWKDRAHFLAAASRAMRTAVVDHARARYAQKRGGSYKRLSLDVLVESFD